MESVISVTSRSRLPLNVPAFELVASRTRVSASVNNTTTLSSRSATMRWTEQVAASRSPLDLYRRCFVKTSHYVPYTFSQCRTLNARPTICALVLDNDCCDCILW
jgi:hypothetical protein